MLKTEVFVPWLPTTKQKTKFRPQQQHKNQKHVPCAPRTLMTSMPRSMMSEKAVTSDTSFLRT